jgi:hypothetical protein
MWPDRGIQSWAGRKGDRSEGMGTDGQQDVFCVLHISSQNLFRKFNGSPLIDNAEGTV